MLLLFVSIYFLMGNKDFSLIVVFCVFVYHLKKKENMKKVKKIKLSNLSIFIIGQCWGLLFLCVCLALCVHIQKHENMSVSAPSCTDR